MKRYDAVILGAGPDGLVTAHRLARAGLKVIVLEHRPGLGGHAVTGEFHPGFTASIFADELATIPSRLFWQLDPARHGAVLMPTTVSACLCGGDATLLFADEARMARAAGPSAAPGLISLHRDLTADRAAMSERALQLDESRHPLLAWQVPRLRPWPGEEWGRQSLEEALTTRIHDNGFVAHLTAEALCGRTAAPQFAGTALHLLGVGGGSGMPVRGLSSFAAALESAARLAGAEIRCNADFVDIRVARGRARAIVLADGEEIAAGAVVSTRDVKHTFLDLIAWGALPDTVARQVSRFRMAGARARVLIALDAIPKFAFAKESPDAAHGPIHVIDSTDIFLQAHDAWRAGILADDLPVTLRIPSLTDPNLAPAGKAVMTATLGSVPSRLFDGEWTPAKREKLVKIALAAAEKASPGIAGSVLATKTILPKDVEEILAWTDGDFDGGEIAPDQALGFRPFPEWRDGRTPIRGVYLAGPSAAPSPFLFGAAGECAAESLLADFRGGRVT